MAIELVQCRWRREPTGEGRHMCLSPKMVVGNQGVPDEGCVTCRYRDHDPPPRPRGNCVHLGRIVDTAPCPSCTAASGRPITVPVHLCAVHGRCTLTRDSLAMRVCDKCDDHTPAYRREGAGRIRHLTYHIYPKGQIWRWNIAHLVQRMSLFNGRRIVAVATDGWSDSIDCVREELRDMDIEYIHVANDSGRREMTTHPILLERMSDLTSPHDATFYGHAKGIGSAAVGDGVRRWAEEMYRGCLDYWPVVSRELRDHATCGILLRRTRHPPGVPVAWHYAGSFRWTRNADLYCRDWRRIDEGWMGPETYPGRHFGYEEASCLYGECVNWGWSFYRQAQWDGWTGQEADRWRELHQADRHEPLLMTVILTAHRQPDLIHEAIASVQAQTSDSWQILVMDSGIVNGDETYRRYRSDARISINWEGCRTALGPTPHGQGWAVNECWRRGLVRGDLVLHLSDDDLLHPRAVELLLARARAQPAEGAWYGRARRERLGADGRRRELPPLLPVGPGGPLLSLRGIADGMQVCHRREHRTDWPEAREAAPLADGWWMDALSVKTPIVPLDLEVGTHRHTPLSTFTQ